MGVKQFYLPAALRCPLCGEALVREGGSLYCCGGRRHTYDIAKEGYVNLLPPGRARNAKTGDGADMVRAREEFLAGGGYDRYSREAALFAAGFLMDNGLYRESGAMRSSVTVVDAGCGEGRHTVNMAAAFAEALAARSCDEVYSSDEAVPIDEKNSRGVSITEAARSWDVPESSGEAVPIDEKTSRGVSITEAARSWDVPESSGEEYPIDEKTSRGVSITEAARSCDVPESSGEEYPKIEIIGVDASKYGVQAAAKRYVKNGFADPAVMPCFVAGNIFFLPVADASADVFTSLFAPLPDDEVRRVLKPGGILLICAAGGSHLAEMRGVLYENPVPSGGGAAVPSGFEMLGETVIEYPLPLSSHDEIMALFTMTPFYHNAPPAGREALEKLDSLTVTVQVKCTVAARR